MLKTVSYFLFLIFFAVSCGGGSGGGLLLDAPNAELEGATSSEARVSGTLDDDNLANLPDNSIVRVTNLDQDDRDPFDFIIQEDGSYTGIVCVRTGEDLILQILDSNGNELSTQQDLARSGEENGCDDCDPADFPDPECP